MNLIGSLAQQKTNDESNDFMGKYLMFESKAKNSNDQFSKILQNEHTPKSKRYNYIMKGV